MNQILKRHLLHILNLTVLLFAFACGQQNENCFAPVTLEEMQEKLSRNDLPVILQKVNFELNDNFVLYTSFDSIIRLTAGEFNDEKKGLVQIVSEFDSLFSDAGFQSNLSGPDYSNSDPEDINVEYPRYDRYYLDQESNQVVKVYFSVHFSTVNANLIISDYIVAPADMDLRRDTVIKQFNLAINNLPDPETLDSRLKKYSGPAIDTENIPRKDKNTIIEDLRTPNNWQMTSTLYELGQSDSNLVILYSVIESQEPGPKEKLEDFTPGYEKGMIYLVNLKTSEVMGYNYYEAQNSLVVPYTATSKYKVLKSDLRENIRDAFHTSTIDIFDSSAPNSQ